MIRVLLVVGLSLTAAVSMLSAQAMSGWRGDGTGRFPGAKPALSWSPTERVLWKTPLPGGSPASPIVVRDRIFVLSDPYLLICLRAGDGTILWKRSHTPADLGEAAAGAGSPDLQHNPDGHAGSAACTSVSDGRHIYAVFANGIVSCHDLEGNRKWARFVEKPKTGFGHASSPLLVGNRLFVQLLGFIALDAATGDEVWRQELPASHATAVAARIGDTDVIVHPAGSILRANGGKVLAEGLFKLTQSSPVVDSNTLYIHENGALKAFALPKAVSDPFEIASLWKTATPRGQYQIASPVAHGGLVYSVSLKGDWQVTDARTGEIVYGERLPLTARVYVSVELAGDALFVTDQTGKTIVLQPGRQFKVIRQNELDYHPTGSAFLGDRRFVRTHRHVICVGG